MKETTNKTKKPPCEWKMIFANDISDKELILKIYKGRIQVNTPQNMIPLRMGRKPE